MRGKIFGVFAVVVLVGNGFTVLWNLIALGQTLLVDALGASVGLIGFNLVFSAAANGVVLRLVVVGLTMQSNRAEC